MLDRNTITLPGRTAIEPCDLFSNAGHFVHVKRRKRGSAPLSHLFAQSVVSATLLLQEQQYRHEVRVRVENLRPGFGALIAEPPAASSHPVVLALMTDAGRTGNVADELPFFTKVFLRQNVRVLRAMGFAVHLDEIPVDTPAVHRRPPEPRHRRFKPKAPAPNPA
jgi:uncharacterized protein (TIGR04141 family)